MSLSSTRVRFQLVANANSAVRPKPSNTNERMMRLRSRRRKRAGPRWPGSDPVSGIRCGDPVADAMACLDEMRVERLVHYRTQAMDVHA